MNDLEMCKAFAELEGVEVFTNEHSVVCYMPPKGVICAMIHTPYNPFGYALNCKARDDYGVSVIHSDCDDSFINVSVGSDEDEWVSEKSDIPNAVIECILKSKGLYK